MNDNPRPAEEDNDPIVAEVHAARQKLLEQYGGIEGYLRHVRELDAQRHARERDLAEQHEADEAQASKSVTKRIPGKRVKRTRYIQTAKLIVAVDAEMVIPPSDPSKPCLEPETVELLREIHQHAEAGDITWLQARGKVYQLIEATS